VRPNCEWWSKMIFIGPVSCIVFSLLTFCLYALTLKQIRTWPLDPWLWGPSLDCVPFLEFIFWWLSWACWKCCLLGKKRQVGKLSWTHLISDGGLFYTWILFSQDMWKQHSGMKHTLSKCIIIRVKNNVLICSPKVCFLSVTVIGNTECTTLSSLNHNSCQVVVLGCHCNISLWLWVESSYQQRSLWGNIVTRKLEAVLDVPKPHFHSALWLVTGGLWLTWQTCCITEDS